MKNKLFFLLTLVVAATFYSAAKAQRSNTARYPLIPHPALLVALFPSKYFDAMPDRYALSSVYHYPIVDYFFVYTLIGRESQFQFFFHDFVSLQFITDG